MEAKKKEMKRRKLKENISQIASNSNRRGRNGTRDEEEDIPTHMRSGKESWLVSEKMLFYSSPLSLRPPTDPGIGKRRKKKIFFLEIREETAGL